MTSPTTSNNALHAEINNINEINNDTTITETTNIINDVKLLVKNNFDEIKKQVKETMDRLDDNPLALDVITILMENVELNNKQWKLNGRQKEELVIIFCKLLADEFKNHPSKELETLSIILNNEREIRRNIALIFQLSEGIFHIQNSWNPEDGLEDEIKTINNCCIPIFNTLFKRKQKKRRL